MEREILFRGKRKDNGEWIEGGYAEHDGKVFIVTWVRYMPDTRDWDTAEYYENNPHYNSSLIEVVPETVSQYTGLTDKNGRKIFEGDIVEVTEGSLDCDNGKGNVLFYEGLWYVDGEPQNSLYDLRNIGDHEIEVIGNIFDNEELLNQ